jgi:hypothetical protein
LIAWQKQGAALVGELRLSGGQPAHIVLVGDPLNEKGAVVMTSGADGARQTQLLADAADRIDPVDLIDILCMQERSFGTRGLAPAESLG